MRTLTVLILALMACALNAQNLWPQQPEHQPRLGLVLSGGGAKGVAHIGVLKVLEEEGITPSYITGTSMGAIIGGLYACGYSAAQLEQIALTRDWEELLMDRVPRTSLPILEKDENSSFLVSFALEDHGISLPKGLVSGQNLGVFLSRLTWHVHSVRNFSNLPIPFACVATDIVTGQAVLLDTGFLPQAMRASMSIPTLLTPMEIDGRLLVDGGVVRNLPVQECRDLGADYVVGINVGAPLMSKDKLDSLIKIMQQSVALAGEKSVEEAEDNCDLLIKPDIAGFDMTSFTNIKDLIAAGETAARKALPQLRSLKARIGDGAEKCEPVETLNQEDSLPITDIKLHGLKRVSPRVVDSMLELEVPGMIKLAEVEAAVKRLYGSRFFERVSYRLLPDADGVCLNLYCTEKQTDLLRLGFNFNNDTHASLMVNTVLLNKIVNGSRFSLTARLSENPCLSTEYFLYTGVKPEVGLGIRFEHLDYDIFDWGVNPGESTSHKLAQLNYISQVVSIELRSILAYHAMLGIGVQKQYSNTSTEISSVMEDDYDSEYTNFYGYFKADTFDHQVYAHRGTKFNLEYKIITEKEVEALLLGLKSDQVDMINRFFVSMQKNFALSKNLTLSGGASIGTTSSDRTPEDYLFYAGGEHPVGSLAIPFYGLSFMESVSEQIFTTNLQLQYEPIKDWFLIARYNNGKFCTEYKDLFDGDDMITGWGVASGWLSPIGPIEFSVYKLSGEPKVKYALSIGYQF